MGQQASEKRAKRKKSRKKRNYNNTRTVLANFYRKNMGRRLTYICMVMVEIISFPVPSLLPSSLISPSPPPQTTSPPSHSPTPLWDQSPSSQY